MRLGKPGSKRRGITLSPCLPCGRGGDREAPTDSSAHSTTSAHAHGGSDIEDQAAAGVFQEAVGAAAAAAGGTVAAAGKGTAGSGMWLNGRRATQAAMNEISSYVAQVGGCRLCSW
jgi:hypothetical protein